MKQPEKRQKLFCQINNLDLQYKYINYLFFGSDSLYILIFSIYQKKQNILGTRQGGVIQSFDGGDSFITKLKLLWKKFKGRTVAWTDQGEMTAVGSQDTMDLETLRYGYQCGIHKTYISISITFQEVRRLPKVFGC